MAAVASGIALLEWCARLAYRSWFLKHILLPAEQNGIDPTLIVRIFRETKPNSQTPDNVKALLGKVKVLERLIRERNPFAAE